MKKRISVQGGILVMTMVFTMMFLVMFVALVNLTSSQYKQSVLQAQDNLAFHIAEAGLDYGRWRLSHDHEFLDSETREFNDQLAGELGYFEVTFEKPQVGTNIFVITSTGYTTTSPNRQVTLRARYGIPSLARYSLLTNSDFWYSAGSIQGSVHANGGIRMDGTTDSMVFSTQETYVCQTHHGCENEIKPGVWGDGGNQDLWEYPVPTVDFNSITNDLLHIKNVAEANNTYYGPSGRFGYYIVFNPDNTYSIYTVRTKQGNVRSWFYDTGWRNMSHDINHIDLIETKDVPSEGVIFVEDHLWIEGEIRDRVTVAAGVFPDTTGTNVDIIINGDLSYDGVRDGSHALGVIAQRHIMFPFFAASNISKIEGAFVAQKGSFHRRYYNPGSPHSVIDAMDRYGMIASNGEPVTNWVNPDDDLESGFEEGIVEYDYDLFYGPPPHFPAFGQVKLISWEQL